MHTTILTDGLLSMFCRKNSISWLTRKLLDVHCRDIKEGSPNRSFKEYTTLFAIHPSRSRIKRPLMGRILLVSRDGNDSAVEIDCQCISPTESDGSLNVLFLSLSRQNDESSKLTHF